MANCFLLGSGGGGENWITSIPEMHRNIFRGKNLGSEVTAAQLAAIADGSFDDLYVGDYWEINDIIWRIGDIDYWYGTSDTAFNIHHIVVLPDNSLYSAVMNDSDTTTGGYVGSKMYRTNLAQAKTMINTAFPDMVLTHQEVLVDAVSNGIPSSGNWYDSTVDLMNEPMAYGRREFMAAINGSYIPYNFTIDKVQLALFRLVPSFIAANEDIWLRDIVSSNQFSAVNKTGNSLTRHANTSHGVRPVFAIGVAA